MATATIVGFGSLLSGGFQGDGTDKNTTCLCLWLIMMWPSHWAEVSARSTFGDAVRNFRLARMTDFRRVFAHPASIFFARGIANLATKVRVDISRYVCQHCRADGDVQEVASLSTEPAPGCAFLISVFDIPADMLPSFYEREEEFRIISAPFVELDGSPGGEARVLSIYRGAIVTSLTLANCTAGAHVHTVDGRGVHPAEVRVMRLVGGDITSAGWLTGASYGCRGQKEFDEKYKRYGLDSIWGWDHQSGILPCRVGRCCCLHGSCHAVEQTTHSRWRSQVYLRHCLLAVKKLGDVRSSDKHQPPHPNSWREAHISVCVMEACLPRLCAHDIPWRPQDHHRGIHRGEPDHHARAPAGSPRRPLQRVTTDRYLQASLASVRTPNHREHI